MLFLELCRCTRLLLLLELSLSTLLIPKESMEQCWQLVQAPQGKEQQSGMGFITSVLAGSSEEWCSDSVWSGTWFFSRVLFNLFFFQFLLWNNRVTTEAVFFIFCLFLTCGMEAHSFHDGWSHAFESKTYLPSLFGNCRTLWIVPFFKL